MKGKGWQWNGRYTWFCSKTQSPPSGYIWYKIIKRLLWRFNQTLEISQKHRFFQTKYRFDFFKTTKNWCGSLKKINIPLHLLPSCVLKSPVVQSPWMTLAFQSRCHTSWEEVFREVMWHLSLPENCKSTATPKMTNTKLLIATAQSSLGTRVSAAPAATALPLCHGKPRCAGQEGSPGARILSPSRAPCGRSSEDDLGKTQAGIANALQKVL